MSVRPTLTRSTSKSGYYASRRRIFEEDRKIKEGIALLVKRKPDGKKKNMGLVMIFFTILLNILREYISIRGFSSLLEIQKGSNSESGGGVNQHFKLLTSKKLTTHPSHNLCI